MVVFQLTLLKFQMCLISILLVLDITLVPNYRLLSTRLMSISLITVCQILLTLNHLFPLLLVPKFRPCPLQVLWHALLSCQNPKKLQILTLLASPWLTFTIYPLSKANIPAN